MRVPVVLLAGVDPTAMAATMVGLQFELPGTVAVRHHIDVERQVLTRTVSDVHGVVEWHEVELEHACVTCAIREDIVPTLERLARDGRWQSVVAHLPAGAQPVQLCAVVERDARLARWLRISAVVTAVGASDPVHDLLGDDLLADRGLHSAHDDRRGVGEVLCAMVEYADLVVLDGPTDPVARGLVRTLARSDVRVVEGATALDAAVLTGSLHDHRASEAWTHPARTEQLPLVAAEGVWQLDLRSPDPFHPGRLLESIGLLGAGRHRSRGCFWLPTRPGRVLEWNGAGGQLGIGDRGPWGGQRPFTRLVMTGTGIAPGRLRTAFAELLHPVEEGGRWHVTEDGFEPWLGPIREAA